MLKSNKAFSNKFLYGSVLPNKITGSLEFLTLCFILQLSHKIKDAAKFWDTKFNNLFITVEWKTVKTV